MSATLKDVAREARVSTASVSRALNGTGAVGEAIRARVIEVAARLNYVPNIGAQSLMTRRTRMVGLLLPRLHGEFFSELIRGADQAAREFGLHLLISTPNEDAAETSLALRTMIGRVDGLLAMVPHVNGRFLQDTLRSALPVLLISTVDVEHAYAAMHVDNYGGAYAMVKHLAGCGHQFIAHIKGRHENMDAEERLRGYRDAMAQEVAGGRELILEGDFTEESGYAVAQTILASADRPQAIFAANDMMAIGCMSALLEAGLRIPEDIAVVGFDDVPTSRFVRPALTTVCVKIADLGARAITRLAETINAPNAQPPLTETVPAEVVVRSSCGANALNRRG
jgi:LacI family transcriptional regulator